MELHPLIDTRIDQGAANNQILQFNATTGRFEVTLTPSGLTSIGTGSLTATGTVQAGELILNLVAGESSYKFSTDTFDDALSITNTEATKSNFIRLYTKNETDSVAIQLHTLGSATSRANWEAFSMIASSTRYSLVSAAAGSGTKRPLSISAGVTDQILLSATSGLVTFGGNIIIPNGGLIGSASRSNAITIASDGFLTIFEGINVGGNATIQGQLTVGETFRAEDNAEFKGDVILNSVPGPFTTKLARLTGPSGLYINGLEEITTTPLTSGTMGYFELNTPGGILKPTSTVDFELPGDLTVGGTSNLAETIISPSNVPTRALVINQGQDNQGIQLNGFDDVSGSNVVLRINANGEFNIESTGVTQYKVAGNNVIDFSSGQIRVYQTVRQKADNLQYRFGIDEDYSIMYRSSTDSLDILEGKTAGTNVRWSLDPTGIKMGDVATNYTQISATGDLVFVGTAGLVYGFIEGDHINWTQASATQNTWYNISDADIVDRFLNSVTHDGNGKMTVTKAGIYWVAYNVSWEVNAANVHIEFGVEVNGSGTADATGPHLHAESKFGNQESDSGTGALMDLAANSTIEVSMRTIDAGTPNFKVDNVHLTCYQIGGT